MKLQDAYDHVPGAARATVDALSVSVIVGTLFDHLPSIAAGLSIIWTAIRIAETRTVRTFFARFRKNSPDNSK